MKLWRGVSIDRARGVMLEGGGNKLSGRLWRVVAADAGLGIALKLVEGESDGLLVARAGGAIDRFALANAHPEASLHTLFGKVWYEGYAKPEYVWQSTAATDDFEPKMSLVPLVFGTIKGTFYALLFAIPLGVLGALYTSQFVHPSIRARIKPTIEIMAALPSVVIGFVAGLYLAAVVERNLVGVMLLFIMLPVFGTSGFLIWNVLPHALKRRVKVGAELLVIIPLLLIGGWVAITVAPFVEAGCSAATRGSGSRRRSASPTTSATASWSGCRWALRSSRSSSPSAKTRSAACRRTWSRHRSPVRAADGRPRCASCCRRRVGRLLAVMIGFSRAVGGTMIVLMATGTRR